MSDLHSTPDHNRQAQSAAAGQDSFAQTFAVYGALLLIAAVVFGTLSFRPF